MITHGCEKGVKIDNYMPSEGQTTTYEVFLPEIEYAKEQDPEI